MSDLRPELNVSHRVFTPERTRIRKSFLGLHGLRCAQRNCSTTHSLALEEVDQVVRGLMVGDTGPCVRDRRRVLELL